MVLGAGGVGPQARRNCPVRRAQRNDTCQCPFVHHDAGFENLPRASVSVTGNWLLANTPDRICLVNLRAAAVRGWGAFVG
jgi:hypothetical protein